MTTSGGFSVSRLGRLHEAMAEYVDRGEIPGLVTAVSRRGDVHVDALGVRSLEGRDRMSRDTLFRIASLTKPLTAAAAMILVEECRVRLDDPVDEWLPELADRRVLRSIEGPISDTVPAQRPITLRDLLTLRPGIGAIMARPGTYPVQSAMTEAGIAPSADIPDVPPDELLRRFGRLPLVSHPGQSFHYHSGFDLLGVLIARASGQSLGTFMRERIFDPLGMQNTGFSVPSARAGRLVTFYRSDPNDGSLRVYDDPQSGRFTKPPALESGGSGLVSTAEDYLAFCQMMLNKGNVGSERILSRRSVELMTTNHLTPAQRREAALFVGEDSGWGFGVAVNLERNQIFSTPGRFGWNGGYGTTAYTDPEEGLIGVLLTQRMMDSPQPPPVFIDFWTSVYQAIAD